MVLFESTFSKLAEHLKANISWLDRSYGKSQLLYTDKGKRYPAIHKVGREYLSLMPNDSMGNFSFVILDDPQEIEEGLGMNSTYKANFSVVFWFDFETITGDIRDFESIKKEVLKVLRGARINNVSMRFNRIFERSANIYREYDLKEVEGQFLMHPYGGLRIDGVIRIDESC